MSLINDALRRARETQRNDPPSGALPLPPVEPPARGGTGWILAIVAVLFLAAACFFIVPVLFGHKNPPVAPAKSPMIPLPPPVEAVSAPAPVTNAAPPPVTDTNSPTVPVDGEQLPKVQGIIFNASHPLAIVNGKAVNIGDIVGDYQVKQILKNSVVFQRRDGSQKTLEIGE
jgi:hypothetical protein